MLNIPPVTWKLQLTKKMVQVSKEIHFRRIIDLHSSGGVNTWLLHYFGLLDKINILSKSDRTNTYPKPQQKLNQLVIMRILEPELYLDTYMVP
jgi:hypothetical protein